MGRHTAQLLLGAALVFELPNLHQRRHAGRIRHSARRWLFLHMDTYVGMHAGLCVAGIRVNTGLARCAYLDRGAGALHMPACMATRMSVRMSKHARGGWAAPSEARLHTCPCARVHVWPCTCPYTCLYTRTDGRADAGAVFGLEACSIFCTMFFTNERGGRPQLWLWIARTQPTTGRGAIHHRLMADRTTIDGRPRDY